MKQLLDAILELVRLVLAQILDPRPVMREFGRLHRTLDHGIVDAVEFEREEQQMHRRVGQPLGNVAVEFGDRGIDAVAGVNQAGIGPEAPGEIVDRLVAPDRLGEPAAADPLAPSVPRACPCSRSQTRRIRRPSCRGRARLPARRSRNRDRPGSIPAACRDSCGLAAGLSWRFDLALGCRLAEGGCGARSHLVGPVSAFRPRNGSRVRSKRTRTFKRALIGIGDSAPIRDR